MVNRRRDEEKKGSGFLWPFTGAGAERILRWFLTAPDAWLARTGFAAALALNLAWLTAALAVPPDAGRGSKLSGIAARPALDMRDALYSPRTMITGFKNILAPDFSAVEPAPSPSPRPEGSAEAAPPGLGLPASGGPEGETAGKEGDKKEGKGDKAAEEAAAAAAASASAAGGAAGRGVMGGVAGLRTGGLSPAGAAGGSGGSSAQLALGENAERSKKALLPGRKAIARAPVRSRGAMDQLKFAQNQSNAGRRAATSEKSYQAADTAFQGQTAQPGGIPASAGAPTTAPPPAGPGEGGPTFAGYERSSCPSGYHMSGGSCHPIETRNATPYQGLVELARKFLIAAAVLAALGLFLLVKGGPSGQLFGGLLLGAAIGLALAAVAIGNSIEKEYGQTPQKKAIDTQANKSLNP